MTSTSFAQNSAPRLFYWLLQQQFNGRVRIELEGEAPFGILFRAGLPWFCDRADQKAFLGELLLKRKLISWEQLQHALILGAQEDLRLGEQLLIQGLITPQALAESLAWQCEHKLLPLFALEDGLIHLENEPTASTKIPPDLRQGVNSLHLILQGMRLHWPTERIQKHRAALTGSTVTPSPAFLQYKAHFRFNDAEKQALRTLEAGFCVGEAGSSEAIERLIFMFWNCNMLQAQGAPATQRSAPSNARTQAPPAFSPSRVQRTNSSGSAASSSSRVPTTSGARPPAPRSAGVQRTQIRSATPSANPPGHRPAASNSSAPKTNARSAAGTEKPEQRASGGNYARPRRPSRSVHSYHGHSNKAAASNATSRSATSPRPSSNRRARPPTQAANPPAARNPANAHSVTTPLSKVSNSRAAAPANSPRSSAKVVSNSTARSTGKPASKPASKLASKSAHSPKSAAKADPSPNSAKPGTAKISPRRLKKSGDKSSAKPGAPHDQRRQFMRDLENIEALVKAEANAFSLFDLSLDADRRTIRRRWSEMSRRFHPDTLSSRNMGDLKTRVQHVFSYLSAGYQTLSHPKKRAELKKALEAGCENIGAGEDAAQVVRRALEAENLVKKAEKLVKKQHFEKAAELYEKALSMESKDPNASAGLAWCQYNTSARDESSAQLAQQSLQKICEDNPNCADAHYFLGLVALQRQSHNAARSALSKALELNPRLTDAERQLRILKMTQNQASSPPKKRGLFG